MFRTIVDSERVAMVNPLANVARGLMGFDEARANDMCSYWPEMPG